MYERFNPLVDFVFKKIFGDEKNKDILIDFLNAELKMEKPIESIEILNPNIDKDASGDKLSILDICARLEGGELVNIEVQVNDEYNIDKRSLYYWSRLYSGQLTSGADYLQLKKTICINILNYKTLETDSFQSIFHLRDDKTGLKLSDDIEIHFIEMPKFEFAEIDYNDKLKNWLLFLKDPNSKSMEVVMEKETGVKKAMTVLEVLSQDKAERWQYEKHMMDEIHHRSSLISAEMKGKDEGKLEGKIEGTHAIVKNMKQMGVDASTIARYTGLSESEIDNI